MAQTHADRLRDCIHRASLSELSVGALALPLAFGFVTACGGDSTSSTDGGECGDDDCDVKCNDGVDNDGNGDIDCADTQCGNAPNCMLAAYGIPYETECSDGLDNDNDGDTDCDDADCAPGCLSSDYAAPMENCSDGIDNDLDGYIDCLDSDDCSNAPNCLMAAYGVPMNEDCSNNIDDDLDGLVDCADTIDCADSPTCQGEKYATILEICDDNIDNDGDELTDCLDDDCAADPYCLGTRYGIPN